MIALALDRLVSGNPLNVQTRSDLLIWAVNYFSDLNDPLTILFGAGLKSTISLVSDLSLGTNTTLDNTYTTLLIETGLFGLLAYIYMACSILFSLRKYANKDLHWYSILAIFVAGVSFTTIYYSTFNLIWVASTAILYVNLAASPKGPPQRK